MKHSLLAALISTLWMVAFAEQPDVEDASGMTVHYRDMKRLFDPRGYSPYEGKSFPEQVFWGDTHLHSRLSIDAGSFGLLLDLGDAYRFARGEAISSTHGERVRLSRPLDWLVVSDHSDAMCMWDEIVRGNPALASDKTVRDWHQRANQGGASAQLAALEAVRAAVFNSTLPDVLKSASWRTSVWEQAVKVADSYYEPHRFTPIIGYEWTSTEMGNNLHRNVLYRDGGEVARRMLPFTANESYNPEDLWQWMARYEAETGGRVLALAHNGNLSNGLMFPLETNPATGKPLSADYARTRARWEPLYEVTQIKGDGETHPLLSPNDEFAGYEIWDKGNLDLSRGKRPEMLRYEYAREALKSGLKLAESLGINPYKFGLVGSTDSHTGLATAEENNFFGKASGLEPSPARMTKVFVKSADTTIFGWEMAGSGYTGVWAVENTREAIFDGMMRREVYATTGPRIKLRFFAGWEFDAADANPAKLADIGYRKGVPMGGDLTFRPEGKTLTFLVAALKDSQGGNLDRIQIVKGWLDASGELHERVYDIACGGRMLKEHRCDGAVGNTVDIKNASWLNTIGAAEMVTVWSDPNFEPRQSAFYYVRVIEIPTPRWTAYDANYFKVDPPKGVPMVTQERAYSSPIWYTP